MSFLLPSLSLGFEPEENEVVYLKRRLREEKARAAKAEKARREAEARCHEAEREKAVYRMLARRWQNRLNAMIEAQQRRDPQGVNPPAMAVDMVQDALGDLLNEGVGGLAGLRVLLQQHLDGDESQGDEEVGSDGEQDYDENEAEDMDHNMEDDASEVDEESLPQDDGVVGMLEFYEEESEANSSVAEVEVGPEAASLPVGDHDSVMEDVESAKIRSYDQPRTVSISSDDL